MGKHKSCPANVDVGKYSSGGGLFGGGGLNIFSAGSPKKHKTKDKNYFTKDGVEYYKGVNFTQRSQAQKEKDAAENKRNEFFAKMENIMGKTPEIPLAKIDRPTDFASININQQNIDRKYAGIGKDVKQVTDFMPKEEWNALSTEEQNRMNKSYTDKNTEYFGTEAGDERNIYGKMELSERDKLLKELQAGAG